MKVTSSPSNCARRAISPFRRLVRILLARRFAESLQRAVRLDTHGIEPGDFGLRQGQSAGEEGVKTGDADESGEMHAQLLAGPQGGLSAPFRGFALSGLLRQ